MKTLGISMIVKNEAECIEACLESVKGADEIVIVDTGSEDNTVELCKKYTDKVYTDYKWNDDFSEARNESLKRCTADWILIIDADEVLEVPILGIRHILNNYMTKEVEGHVIRYFGMLFSVQTGKELVASIRIIKNTPAIKWDGAIHNSLTYDGSNARLRAMCYQSKFLIKSGYSVAHFKDPDRTFRILNKQLEATPDNTRLMYYMGRECIAKSTHTENKDRLMEFIDLAIYWLEKYESIEFYRDWLDELSDAEFCLANLYLEKYGLLKDDAYWYQSVLAALKSFAVLPSNQNTADVLSGLMMVIPGGRNYPGAAHYWQKVADNCHNEGVSQIRERMRPDINAMLRMNQKARELIQK